MSDWHCTYRCGFRCRETPDFEWTEMTRLTNVTPFGAGFTLKRPTEKGRLLHMTIPMPRQLRVFDHVEDQYRIWAVVRYMKAIHSPISAPCLKSAWRSSENVAPASYEKEPWKRYDISTTPFRQMATAEEILKPLPSSISELIHGTTSRSICE